MKSLKDISIQFIKGVGPFRKALFANLGVATVEDLLMFFPRRYEDRRQVTPIVQTSVGNVYTITGKVADRGSRRSWFTKKHVTEIIVDDGTGRIYCVWFNQPYLERYFREGVSVVLFGKVDMYKNRIQMVSPEYEVISDDDKENLSVGRIVPIYSLTKGMTQRYLRKVVKVALDKFKDDLEDDLPVFIRNKYRLSNIRRSILGIHFPEDLQEQETAIKRISFEEFFFFQITLMLRRLSVVQKKGIAHKISDALTLKFMASFPFELTSAQKKVIKEIRADMQNNAPMLRLLQGDVGSGKTLVALFGCVAAFENKSQSAIMAPTEILAQQHYENISKVLLGGAFTKMKVVILTSSMKEEDRQKVKEDIKNGKVDLVIGTHALISEDVVFKNLTYVVVDEQHKFGVRQRALLSEKGNNPDVLIMTATPIPRTLCLTLFGELDVSVIDELPPGRGKIKTIFFTEEKADDVYALVREKVKEGRQVYFVYPVIDGSDDNELKAAQKMFKDFAKSEFKGLRLGLIHGQMKSNDAQEVMSKFKNREIDILIATTVIEVGVDVPNASVMVIEHADHFGLSQLHQLRGRIGRDGQQAFCYLIGDRSTEEAHARIKAVLSTTDGFKIAEEDLKIRGPGQFFGRLQHGLPEFKVANPATQLDMLELARKEALTITQEDPKLDRVENRPIKQIVFKRYPTFLVNVEAG